MSPSLFHYLNDIYLTQKGWGPIFSRGHLNATFDHLTH